MLKHKLSYFGHIMHAEYQSLEKSTMLGMIKGRGGTGTPGQSWMDWVKAAIKLPLPELQESVAG